MPIQLCSFIRETGRQCGSPAMRGNDRCFYHERDRLRRQILATWRVNGDAHPLASMALPPLDTPEEVQICINAVFQAIAVNRIDAETRRTLIDMLRLASRNLRTGALIRHFAAKDARAAKSGHEFTRADQDSSLVKGQGFSPANADSSENTAAASLPLHEQARADAEEMPPQEADAELLAQLQSREDDRKAFDNWVAQRVWTAPPPKPKPKSEVSPSPFPEREPEPMEET